MVGSIEGLTGGRTIAMQDTAKSAVIDQDGKAANSPASSSVASTSDTVSLSAGVERLQQIELAMASETAPFDKAKVDSIKARIAAGEYTIDADRIAEKFLETEQLLDSL
ncbi:MAG: flagellar biosynthesis anti-sigma factor FlgM [Pseudomonadota bacterium]